MSWKIEFLFMGPMAVALLSFDLAWWEMIVLWFAARAMTWPYYVVSKEKARSK